MKLDLSRWKTSSLERLSRLLSSGSGLWFLPLVLAVMPLWQAWECTCAVPRADHWNVIAEPYLRTVDGGPLWDFIHSPGTDSRHDAPKLLHYLVIKATGWNLWVESMVCVVLGILAAWMGLSFWRHHPGPILARWGYGWVSTFCILSPMQWMNWVWGIQICYTLLVTAAVAMIWVLGSNWGRGVRVLLAVGCALVAVFSFLNGWMVWGLGLAGVVVLAVHERWPLRVIVWSVVGWLVVGGVAGWIYLLGWPEAKEIGEGGLLTKLIEVPGDVILFFLQVLGGPLSELALLEQRADRHLLQSWSAPVLGILGFGLLVFACAVWWRRRSDRPLIQALPWGLMLLFGLGNALAITVARVGKPGFLVFQSRYPSFTIWFWIGLLGLLLGSEGRTVKWMRRVWLVIMMWGAGVGACQGWRDGIRDARQGHLLEAATAMRHAAVEPVLLDGVRPSGGDETVAILDRLDDLRLLHLARVMGDFVSDSKVNRERIYLGAMTESRAEGRGIYLRGWALRADTRRAAKAVAISCQTMGQPERWLGLASKASRERSKAAKNKSRELEDRIGWAYEPLTGKETSFMTNAPLRMKRTPLPSGEVTLRAYGFDPVSGEFSPLGGETALRLP